MWVDSSYMVFRTPWFNPKIILSVPSIYGLKDDLYEKYNLMHIKVDPEQKIIKNQAHTPH